MESSQLVKSKFSAGSRATSVGKSAPDLAAVKRQAGQQRWSSELSNPGSYIMQDVMSIAEATIADENEEDSPLKRKSREIGRHNTDER